MTQSNGMSGLGQFLPVLLLSILPLSLCGQSQEDTLQIYTEHPRLFLRPNRLKLLKRERERRSLRWLQFETLMAGRAQMPERGFANAFYYRIAGDEDAGRQAVAWALGPGTDLRQLALVFDWCQDILNDSQSKALAGKLQRGIEQAKGVSVSAVRSRLLASVALADHVPQISIKQMEQIIHGWWQETMVPALRGGTDVIPRDDDYALMEILHAVRDNLNIDLRDSVPVYFKGLPIYHLMSYYPATYPAAEGEYRIPAVRGGGIPDLRRATLSRAAELSMVAFDTNAPQTQVLQGWLMHDNFLLRSTFGITYEFLWANPYQPGLSYYHVPLVFHDDLFGRLFVRSSWEESASWLGFFDNELQLFRDGKVTVLNPQLSMDPISLTEAVVLFGKSSQKFKIELNEEEDVFVVGLKPLQAYDIEVDDEEMLEQETDRGGILPLTLPRKRLVGVLMKEAQTPKRGLN